MFHPNKNSHLPPLAAQPAPLVPKDISKTLEFMQLKNDVITALRNTTDYTMTLTSLQKSVSHFLLQATFMKPLTLFISTIHEAIDFVYKHC